ncbi:AAA family ATPase [Lysinibacillus fusiformis]|uniref:AAA family ATPase n=1 Tax=Lysinibacillus fusiformis TaxID=28031 RepID=UPI002EB84493|nr:AAA family ATPase [Lysinibacillus fusiformis]
MFYSELIKIIDGALKQDVKKVINYSNHISQKLRVNGEVKVADRIDKLIHSENQNVKESLKTNSIKQVPFDQESRLELGDIKLPNQINIDDESLKLSKENYRKVNEFIESYKQIDKLVENGIDSKFSLLLYGPPGCGKTMSANYIAKEINLPLIVVRLDSLVSSYLGSTAKNIRKIFEFTTNNPCVLFLDEFDAIAKMRDDKQELGEIKRIVNSLLQNIDELNSNIILIAATNHEELLDKAVWRRFSSRIKMNLPEIEQRKKYIIENIYINDTLLDNKDVDFFSNITDGMSYSDLNQVIQSARKNAILNNSKVDFKQFIQSIFDYALSGINSEDETVRRKEELKFILNKTKDISNRNLAKIWDCHYTTVGRYRKELGL